MSEHPALCPVAAVEVAVADSLLDVVGEHAVAAFKIGDGARHAEDAVVGACRHVEPRHSVFQFFESGSVWLRILVHQCGGHLGVAVHALDAFVAACLYFARPDHAFAYGCAALGRGGRRDVVKFHWRHFHLQVDAVEERAGDAVEIVLHGAG